MASYANALREAITPGCTVIDIGASFGMFPILACHYGAGKVIAIEPDPSVELIMQLAKANGCADRIEVFRGMSTEFEPDAPADVLISDLRGILPLFETHVATIRDARERLLKPGGAQLPAKDTIHMGLVRSERLYRTASHPWRHNDYGVDLTPAIPFVVNRMAKAEMRADEVASAPALFTQLDYHTIEAPDAENTVTLTAESEGPVHGIAAWFDAEIAPGHSFSNAPGEPTQIYGQLFMPFEQPVTMAAGTSVEVRLRARLINGEYTMAWDSRFLDKANGETLTAMHQSSFKSHILPPSLVQQRDATQVPTVTRDIAVERAILQLIDGETSVQQIAQKLLEAHPDMVTDYKSALDRATKAVLRYS